MERYRILGMLGRGGMGTVWRALDRRTDQVVALKRLDPRRAERPVVFDLFVREFWILSSLRVSGVPRAHHLDASGEAPYFTMEVVPGTTFDEHLRRARPGWRRVAGLVARAALRLAAVHRAGYVHGDVKPPNLIVDPSGEPWWVDFGVGSAIEGELLAEEDEYVFGTLAYLPVERIQAEPVLRDPRSDVYSLGVLLHEALTGRPPFLAADSTDLMAKIESAEPADVHRVAGRGIPAALSAAIRAAMAKRREDRPATADEFARAVLDAIREPHGGDPRSCAAA